MRPLRPYQAHTLQEVRGLLAQGLKRIIICLPTGAGKTHIAASMMELAASKKNNSIFIADREVLVLQASDRLAEDWIPHGIIMSDKSRSSWERIQVASAQTLEARGWFPSIDLGVVDEAHSQRKKISEFIVNSGKPFIGLTATPFTQGMGRIWQGIVNGTTTNELIRDGVLCPLEIYIATPIDMAGAKVTRGEWSDRTAADRALPIVGNIVTDYVSHTNRIFRGPVPTLVFSPTVDYGEELCRHFAAAGLRFEQISYRDRSTTERQHKIRLLADGRIHGLVSCEALAKGFDLPIVQCIVMARPYRRSMASVIQALGRGMRGHEAKKFCLLLDHAQNFLRFAPEIEQFWAKGWPALDDGRKKERKRQVRDPEESDRRCRECGYVMPPDAEVCPACGCSRPRRRTTIAAKPGRMRKYDSLALQVGDLWPHISRMAVDRHPNDPARSSKWARIQYKDLVGRWPPYDAPLTPAHRADDRVVKAVERKIKAYYVKRRYQRQKKENA